MKELDHLPRKVFADEGEARYWERLLSPLLLKGPTPPDWVAFRCPGKRDDRDRYPPAQVNFSERIWTCPICTDHEISDLVNLEALLYSWWLSRDLATFSEQDDVEDVDVEVEEDDPVELDDELLDLNDDDVVRELPLTSIDLRSLPVYQREALLQKVRNLARSDLSAASFVEPDTYHTGEDYLEAAIDPPHPVVEGLVFEDTNATLAALHKVGKTTLSLNLLKCYADEKSFLGAHPVYPLDGRVAWWNYELGRADAREWLRAMRIKNNDGWVALDLRGYSFRLQDPKVQEWAIEWLAERDVKFWIIDPLFTAYQGPENDNNEGSKFTRAVDLIKREAGVSVAFLPGHIGRAGEDDDAPEWRERVRGPSHFDDWPDERFVLVKRNGVRYFKVADSRHATAPERKLGYDHTTKRLWIEGGSRYEEQQEHNLMVMLRVLADEGEVKGTSNTGLRLVMKGKGLQGSNHNSLVDATLQNGRNKGLISVDEATKPYTVTITEEGRKYLGKVEKIGLEE